LDGEDQRQHLEASAPDRSQSLELPNSQPVGQNSLIVDNDDDDITVGTNLEKRQLLMGLQLLLTQVDTQGGNTEYPLVTVIMYQ